ncbi:hypothetical protein K1719_018890 [Acacia pycnantha]|nr:hypothetical protein K1719_018890 [Acacia pycnantha]
MTHSVCFSTSPVFTKITCGVRYVPPTPRASSCFFPEPAGLPLLFLAGGSSASLNSLTPSPSFLADTPAIWLLTHIALSSLVAWMPFMTGMSRSMTGMPTNHESSRTPASLLLQEPKMPSLADWRDISQYQEEAVQGLYRRHKKVKLAKECAKEDRCPPPGKPLSSRVPFELVGDVFQAWEQLRRFHEILSLKEPLSLDELEKELVNPWFDGSVQNNVAYYRYGGWWSVWRMGTYSMVLSKAAFIHWKYLDLCAHVMPLPIQDYISWHRNCEDIAMSFLVANATGAPPNWVKGVSYVEYSTDAD